MSNREIKFRAWHKDAKEMIYFPHLHFNIEYRLLAFYWENEERNNLPGAYGMLKEGDPISSYHKDTEDAECWEVMQFTGLKDKNGKEIYEGDIVKNIYGNVEITWDKGGFWSTGKDMYSQDESDWECEVIGNIYENPELLK